MSHEEENRRGPGVIWLDTASGAVLRSIRRYRAIGPGVVFTGAFERLTGTTDLHKQIHYIGPTGSDQPFENKTDDQTEIEYKETQDRRQETSALTRDGIEVVPNILILFKIHAKPARGNQPGS